MTDIDKNNAAPASVTLEGDDLDDLAARANDLLVHDDGTFARGVRWYGIYLTISGWLSLAFFIFLAVSIGILFALMLTEGSGADLASSVQAGIAELKTSTLVIALSIVELVGTLADAIISLKLGKSLRKSIHRNAAVWSRRLMWISILNLSVSYMLSGFSWSFFGIFVKIAALVIFSTVLDPTLAAEKRAAHEREREQDMDAAEKGMLGRDVSGKGYIRLDFYNLFWMFFVCSILGLILEIIWHMTVVDQGVYQDRAGLLIGPFSPIYGFGAVLITIVLNRLYDKNPLITFVVAGLVGGGFEAATAFFMKASFGITAWDYSSYMLFGLMPDPVAVLTGGRTATMFLIIWGLLGLVWVKFVLPIMLKGINLIPWDFRYGLTALVAVFMITDGLLTLGSLDCWFERSSGLEPSTPVETFFSVYCDDDFMKNRFQSMTMDTGDATRKDTVEKKAVENNEAQVEHVENGEAVNPALITSRTV
ncbi:putative ABC transporter permease [Paratractidigestivibacter sp.]|uniref:putative ABC transporter permease n=1 Tax=Paratractidigestivibacter sp. TaxID=2847316 RepID=UPI002AC9A96A|nr:putative ABC transporter permease [Paratractidigestivibacter sp.]